MLSFGSVGWSLQPMPIKVIAPTVLGTEEIVTVPAGRSDQKFMK